MFNFIFRWAIVFLLAAMLYAGINHRWEVVFWQTALFIVLMFAHTDMADAYRLRKLLEHKITLQFRPTDDIAVVERAGDVSSSNDARIAIDLAIGDAEK
jgi:hypothetical protein